MLFKVGVHHLEAAVVLAEELNFTRAAHRLHVTQSALSKQIIDLEAQHRFQLFVRHKKRLVELSDAGRIFVQEARSALLHFERAVQLARTAHEGCETILLIGHSPCADLAWISAMLAIRLALYPKITIRFMTEFDAELVRNVLAGELHIAIVSTPSEDDLLTCVPFSATHVYAILPAHHPANERERLVLQDLANDPWILPSRRFYGRIHDKILETAQHHEISRNTAYEVITAQQAAWFVSEEMGVAIVPRSLTIESLPDGVVSKLLYDKPLSFEACLVMRSNEDSRVVNQFARTFLRTQSCKQQTATQLELSLSA